MFERVDLFRVFASLPRWPWCAKLLELYARHGAVAAGLGVLDVAELVDVLQGGA